MTGPIEAVGKWARAPAQTARDPRERIDQPFTLEGHITGTFTDELALVSGSTNFYVRPQPGETYHIARILVRGYDSSFSDADVYGSAGLLATGIALTLWDEINDVLVYNFTPRRITRIHDWGLYAGTDSTIDDPAQTDTYGARWTFTKANAGTLTIDGSLGHVLRLEVPDPLNAMIGHYVLAQGHKELN
jgi:hypothetical protein